MNLSLILIPASLLYVALIYWILLKFDFKEIWNGSLVNNQTIKSTPLTQVVKRTLDFIFLLSLVLVLIVPIIVVVMAISQYQSPTWGIDISVFSGFKIDLNHMAGIDATGVRKPEFSGKTIINIDTSNLYAWYIFAFISELSAMISLFVVIQLRAIVMSLQNGVTFTQENSQRIKKIGAVVIAWNVLHPLFQYFAWGSVIKDISFNTQGLEFYPAFEVNVMGLLIGSMLILLYKILQEAADMKQEQELTV
ncbi:MAG: DUF2975 domain-containing protein [Methylococcales bacterium]